MTAPKLDIDRLFGGRKVPSWLRGFAENPVVALDDLFLGRAELGLLAPSEPRNVLARWLTVFAGQREFVAFVDHALADWVNHFWGYSRDDGSAPVIARAWCQVGELIGLADGLGNSANALCTRFLDDAGYLDALVEGRPRDPVGATWFALARHQESLDLRSHWLRLCGLPPEEPWYRGRYGVVGLRFMPSGGAFPEHVGHGLIRLAEGLQRRANEGWLRADRAKAEWLVAARGAMAGAPSPKRWRAFWHEADHIAETQVSKWIKVLEPAGAGAARSRQWDIRRAPDWGPRSKQIAQALGRDVDSALESARILLREQALYADYSGDAFNVTRSACSFASRVAAARPQLALDWAHLARKYDPWDPYSWTILANVLIAQGELGKATSVLWETTRRFPNNGVAWNTLAAVLSSGGRQSEAVDVAGEAVRRFPDNENIWTTLVSAMSEAGQHREAVEAAKRATRRFPDHVGSWSVLTKALGNANLRLEAVQAAIQATRMFPQDVVAWCVRAKAHRDAAQMDEAVSAAVQATQLPTADKLVAWVTLSGLRAQMGELDEAIEAALQATQVSPRSVPAWELLASVLTQAHRIDEADAVKKILMKLQRKIQGPKEAPGIQTPPEKAQRTRERASPATDTDAVVSEDGAKLAGDTDAVISEDGAKQARESEEEAMNEVVARPVTDRSHLDTLLADGPMLRAWARRLHGASLRGHPGEVRDQARRRIAPLLAVAEASSQAAGQGGVVLAMVDREGLGEALDLLRHARRRFPGSTWVAYALAWAERERLGRMPAEARYEGLEAVRQAWLDVARLDGRLDPLCALGYARAVALVEGHDEVLREALGTTAWRLHDARAHAAGDDASFLRWWSELTLTALLPDPRVVAKAEDLPADLSELRARIVAAECAGDLDVAEQDYLGRYAAA